MVSCNSDNNVTTIDSVRSADQEGATLDYEQLRFDIENVSYEVYGEPTESRSFKDWWHKIWSKKDKVLGADANGFLKGLTSGSFWGALGGGALSSIAKVVQITIEQYEVNTQTAGGSSPAHVRRKTAIGTAPDAVALNGLILSKADEALRERTDSAGYYHNKIICSMLENELANADIEDLTDEYLMKSVSAAIEREFNLTDGQLQNDANYKAQLYDALSHSHDIDDVNVYDDIYKAYQEKNPELAEILSVVAKYIDGISPDSDDDQIREYSEKVYDVINKSTLDEETKTVLKVGVSVGFASSRLWRIQ